MTQGAEPQVLVLGNGRLARLLETWLARRTSLTVSSATLADDGAVSLDQPAVAVCALEAVPYSWHLRVNALCVTEGVCCLYVQVVEDRIMVGPLVIPGLTPCIECVRFDVAGPATEDRFLPFATGPASTLERNFALADGPLAECHADEIGDRAPLLLIEAVGSHIAGQIGLVIEEHGPDIFPGAVLIGRDLRSTSLRFERAVGSCRCEDAEPDVSEKTALSFHMQVAGAQNLRITPPAPSEYRTVGIVGGGSAGYLTALTFRALQPHMAVTLIESSRVPVIGVGEATTPQLMTYLHRVLGLDVHEFYETVRPTWKLGIRFEWGLPGNHHFDYPFDFGPADAAMQYDGHLGNMTLMTALMSRDRSPILRAGDEHLSMLHRHPFAYHLDNERLVNYVMEKAIERGVTRADCEIVDAVLSPDGSEVSYLVGADGRRFEFDLYVDCSGFRSLLLEGKLGSRFVSYESSLKTDRAIAFDAPHGGTIKPYTTATTMPDGWCWSIPMPDCDHCGYVYASAFCSDDDAMADIERRHPGAAGRLIRFRSGRHEEAWKGNVLALGNAYGFVEPLESTAIAAMLETNLMVHQNFPTVKSDATSKNRLNQMVAEYWDNTRWFLSMHYRFNQRLDSPFWRFCRDETDISGYDYLLEQFRRQPPLQARRLANGFRMFGLGQDVLLFGQGVPIEGVLEPREPEHVFRRRASSFASIADAALPLSEALDLVTGTRPDFLGDLVDAHDSWMSGFYDYMMTCYS